MARQEVSRTTHIEEGELRVTHENAILTNITVTPYKFVQYVTVILEQRVNTYCHWLPVISRQQAKTESK